MGNPLSSQSTIDSIKHLHVTCAIIERNGRVLAAQRNFTMSLPNKWEFPGGKLDNGESLQECLRRELAEEMGICLSVKRALPPYTHHYPTFTVTLYPFICSIEAGDIVLHEHAAIVWLPPDDLHTLDWADADLPVLNNYLSDNETQLR